MPSATKAKKPTKPKKKVAKKPTKVRRSRSGAPAKYETSEVLEIAIEKYFKHCVMGKNGRPRISALMPNKAGLCVFLDISRDTYSEYRKRFPDTIKRADSLIEDEWIQRLKSNAPTGAIFYLKNAYKETYKDRHETDVTSKGQKIESFNESQLERIARRILDGNTPVAA